MLLYALTINHHKVVQRFSTFYGIDTNLSAHGVLGKDIHSVCIIGTLITDFLYHCHRLLVVDDVTNLTDELLWILLKLKEGGVLNTFQDRHDSLTRQSGVSHQPTH